MSDSERLHDRELSWLAFNARVLQEAQDPTRPVFDRLHFLSIVSSNLDEFFRVRVAALRGVVRLRKKKRAELGFQKARRRLRRILDEVVAQQEEFGRTLRGDVLPALERAGIRLWDDRTLPPEARAQAEAWFDAQVRGRLHPQPLERDGEPFFLADRALYLVVVLKQRGGAALAEPTWRLVEIPAGPLPRFVALQDGEVPGAVFLDDVVRLGLPRLFPEHEVEAAWSIKLTRDADLAVEDEFAGDLVEKIRAALARRGRGVPARFLYDASAPWAIVEELRSRLGLEEDDLVAGGRYHNLNDLSAFPDFGRTDLRSPPRAPVPHRTLPAGVRDPWTTLQARDHLLHFPYHAFQPVVDILAAAAGDTQVEELWIALYRVSAGSPVALQLIEAARQGKRVTAFVEVKARFDESTNLEWAARMEDAGVRVLYSKPGIKVHSKLCLIVRREERELRRYAYLSTGNFNEGTARFYTDLGLWTADARLADEVHRVFRYLADEDADPRFEHLLVAPFRLRTELERHVEREIRAARAGEPSGITLKLNSLEDPDMVERLYDAAAAGVPVRLIVRGICCLRPGVPGLSESVQARSIVGPFLEHARVYRFENGGAPRLFVASADWMTRNLDRRVEVAFPVYDPEVAAYVRDWLELQWSDTVRARILDAEQGNAFVGGREPRVDAQLDQYAVLARAAAAPSTGVDASAVPR